MLTDWKPIAVLLTANHNGHRIIILEYLILVKLSMNSRSWKTLRKQVTPAIAGWEQILMATESPGCLLIKPLTPIGLHIVVIILLLLRHIIAVHSVQITCWFLRLFIFHPRHSCLSGLPVWHLLGSITSVFTLIPHFKRCLTRPRCWTALQLPTVILNMYLT